jgi:hypothetical protein
MPMSRRLAKPVSRSCPRRADLRPVQRLPYRLDLVGGILLVLQIAFWFVAFVLM